VWRHNAKSKLKEEERKNDGQHCNNSEKDLGIQYKTPSAREEPEIG
jgi:hypothetical protein